MTGFTAADVPRQDGRVFLVTGANAGIGFEAARVLAMSGARVLLGCRDQTKAVRAMARIRQEHESADIAWLPLDLADLDSVRRAAEVAKREERLDVLVNNAGVMRPPLRHTKDGFELQFGTNHLGHFELTALLLDKLEEGREPRVVTVASLAHFRSDIAFDNLDGRKGYAPGRFYGQSKLANMLFMAELDRRLRARGSPIRSLACHPGVSGTELGRFHWVDKYAFRLANVLFHPPAKACVPTLQAATDPHAEGGDYYGPQGLGGTRGNSGKAARSDTARDPERARRLWDVSIEMTGIDPELPPAS